MSKKSEALDLKLANLPNSPGVYLFKAAKDRIIYIGKAKNLRNRVRTYFQSAQRHDPKTIRMLEKVVDFDLMVTDSEVEALILEANLVREYKPRYNVLLRDDKHFPYVKITNEPFPQVLIVRRLEKDGATYFGPYTNAIGMRRTVNLLCQLFRIRSCKFPIPAPTGRSYKVCLDYRINRCGGPCEGFQSEKEYAEQVESIVMVLSGRSKDLVARLRGKMKEASDQTDYEEAARLRDIIEALDKMMIRQKVDVGEVVDRDIISVARDDKYGVAVVMQIRQGALIGRQDFQLIAEPDETDEAMLETFLMQYYNHQPNLPNEVHLPASFESAVLFKKWLRQLAGHRVRVVTPKVGEKSKLVNLAAANARLLLDEILIQKRKQTERTSKMVTALKDDLHLAKSPRTIVCFDISNTGETDAVGSCVYFANSRPRKAEYRHFKIKGVKGQDDFKMMREIIGRYFYRLKDEGKATPDLVVVDGGKGQLSSALKELKHLGFDEQPIIGLAKRLEEVFLPGQSDPIVINKSSPGLILLKQVRDEAHRFAIEYNRKVRAKRTIKSALDDIKGVGPAKRKALINQFGSVEKIKKLSSEELTSVKGITIALANAILKALNKK